MFTIYLFILLPSLGLLLLAIKGLTPAGIELGGRKGRRINNRRTLSVWIW